MWDYNIADFGAKGEDQTINTEALQSAIDKCHRNGGGRVIVPPGVFIIGSIFLKDNVELHLLTGAELKGSSNMHDYCAEDCFVQNISFASEEVTGAHLIMAIEVTNVSITGRGCINGNSSKFFGPPSDLSYNFSILDQRPGQMICFVECQNVYVAGVELNNATYWTLYVHGCEMVSITGVRIKNDKRTPNGDGIDIDCSRNVTISDCQIFSGDDSITLRGYNERLRDKSRACENVMVTNCVLSSPCNAIRVGVGEGVIRNCSFSNIVITDSRTGLCLISCYGPFDKRGVTIQNIKFSNITMEVVMPFFIASRLEATAPVENITFDNITTTASKTSVVSGNEKTVVRGISFRNTHVEMIGGRDFMNEELAITKIRESSKGSNTAFFISNTDEVVFINFTLKWRKLDAPWRHCFVVKNSTGFELDTSRLTSPYDEQGSRPDSTGIVKYES
jgi:polygalacturonase